MIIQWRKIYRPTKLMLPNCGPWALPLQNGLSVLGCCSSHMQCTHSGPTRPVPGAQAHPYTGTWTFSNVLTSLQPGLSTSWWVLACRGWPALTGFKTTLSPMTTWKERSNRALQREEWECTMVLGGHLSRDEQLLQADPTARVLKDGWGWISMHNGCCLYFNTLQVGPGH